MIFIPVCDDEGALKSVEFTARVQHSHLPGCGFRSVDHEAMAALIRKDYIEACSVIVVSSRLRDELWSDPKYAHQTSHLLCSEIQGEARELMQNRYFRDEEMEEVIKRFELATFENNYDATEEDNRKFKVALEDAIFAAQTEMLYPELLEGYKEQCRVEYDEETEEERVLSEEEFQKAWEKRKMELFMPRTRVEYERVYSAPYPFDHRLYKSSFLQYYFYRNKLQTEYEIGSSSGSGTRETHGRFAHIFATLEYSYEMKIPTFIFHYNELNQMKLVRCFETFKAVAYDLWGNYSSSSEVVDKLFKGRRVFPVSGDVEEYKDGAGLNVR